MKFFVDAPNYQPSFDPSDSDIVRNAVLVEQTVGTLLKEKFGNTGRSEPYLVESWFADDSNLEWTFDFRSNLFCEDGTEINAATYAQSLLFRLRVLSKSHDLPAFNKLRGWKSFYSNESDAIAGVVVVSPKRLILKFDAPPEGLTEYLAMINFGFFSPHDYKDNAWISKSKLTSSGPYRIDKVSSNSVVLKKRADWPLSSNYNSRIESIEYIYTDSTSAIANLDSNSIFPLRRVPKDFKFPEGIKVVSGSPIFLTSLVLSSKRKIFSEKKVRKEFQNRFYQLTRENPFPTQFSTSTETFYPSDVKIDLNSSPLPNRGDLVIGFDPTLHAVDIEYALTHARSAVAKMGFNPILEPFDHSKQDWVARRSSNKFYDIRIASVDIGAAPEKWLLEMMFCSEIGVSFMDPSGEICTLTQANVSGAELKAKFEKIVAEEASVIPVVHSGYIWLLGSSLEVKGLSSTAVVPRVETIKLHD